MEADLGSGVADGPVRVPLPAGLRRRPPGRVLLEQPDQGGRAPQAEAARLLLPGVAGLAEDEAGEAAGAIRTRWHLQPGLSPRRPRVQAPARPTQGLVRPRRFRKAP